MLPEEIIKALVNLGLKESQAKNPTAEAVVKLFMDNDSKTLVELMKAAKGGYEELSDRIKKLKIAVDSITEFQNEVSTEAKDIIALYTALVSVNYDLPYVSGENSMRYATAIVLSYIGDNGKAKLFQADADRRVKS